MDDDFSKELYREHLEEAAFLYDSRRYLMARPDFPWVKMADIEDRLEAHLDGLICGGDGALAVCAERIAKGDPDEGYAAMRVFARHNRLDLIRQALETLAPCDVDRGGAYAVALAQSPPKDLDCDALLSLMQIKPFGGVAPLVIGRARMTGFRECLAHEHCLELSALAALCFAVGRLRDFKNAPLTDRAYATGKDALMAAYAVSRLFLGRPEAIQMCLEAALQEKAWPFTWLGLSAGAWCAEELRKMFIRAYSPKKEALPCLEAIGLLGDPDSIDFLIGRLNDPKSAADAARGLQWMTGAGLYEEAFIPDPIDEAELYDDELERLHRGEPVYPPGEAPGKTVTRLSQKAQDWQNWLKAQAKRFTPGLHYRHGRLFSPACLWDTLRAAGASAIDRQVAKDELAIRYVLNPPFETDDPVDVQQKAIADFEGRMVQAEKEFQAGQWYFNGRIQDARP